MTTFALDPTARLGLLAAGISTADAVVAKALGLSETAQMARAETRLARHLLNTWEVLAREAAKKAAAAVARGATPAQVAAAVDATMKRWAPAVVPEFKAEVAAIYRLARVAGFRKAKGYTKAPLTYDAPTMALVKKAKTELAPSFDVTDKKAVEALTKHQVFWVGEHYEENVSHAVAETAKTQMVEAGVSARVAGKVMADKMLATLGKVVTPTGYGASASSYMTALVANAATVARAHGQMRSFKEVGVTHYEIVNPVDERTCPVCKHMDGKVFTVESGMGQVEEELDAKTPAEVRKLHPWLSPKKLAEIGGPGKAGGSMAFALQGQALPPFHFRCRCAVDVSEETSFESTKDPTPYKEEIPNIGVPVVVKESFSKYTSRVEAGLTTILEVDGPALERAFKEATGEALAWKKARLEALRKLDKPLDAHPEFFLDSWGKLAVGDGRHRSALASERQVTIQIAVKPEDADKIKKLVDAQNPKTKSKVIYEEPPKAAKVEVPPTPPAPKLPTSATPPVMATDIVKPTAPTSTPAPLWPDHDELIDVKKLGGSTGARLVKDKQGNLYVSKFGKSAEHLKEEHAADVIYRAMGAAVPESTLYDVGGKPHKLAKFLDGKTLSDFYATASPADIEAIHKQLRKDFALDAVLGNRDVIGLGADNVLVHKGIAYRIDNGASLRYRAQGAKKSDADWGPKVTEWEGLRNASKNASAAKVYGGMTDDELKESLDRLFANEQVLLASIDDATVRATVKARMDYLRPIHQKLSKTEPPALPVVAAPAPAPAVAAPPPGPLKPVVQSTGHFKPAAPVPGHLHIPTKGQPQMWDGTKWKPYKEPVPEGLPKYTGPTSNPKAAKPGLKPAEPVPATQPAPALPTTLTTINALPTKPLADLKAVDWHAAEDTWKTTTAWNKRAYGGVVFNDKGQVLLREPTNHFDGYHWTFPKGKLDNEGESPVTAALREVAEETGQKGEIIGVIPGGHKSGSSESFFFMMRSVGEDKTLMDWETASTKWVDFEEAKKLIAESTNVSGRQRDLGILEAAEKAHKEALAKGSSLDKYKPAPAPASTTPKPVASEVIKPPPPKEATPVVFTPKTPPAPIVEKPAAPQFVTTGDVKPAKAVPGAVHVNEADGAVDVYTGGKWHNAWWIQPGEDLPSKPMSSGLDDFVVMFDKNNKPLQTLKWNHDEQKWKPFTPLAPQPPVVSVVPAPPPPAPAATLAPVGKITPTGYSTGHFKPASPAIGQIHIPLKGQKTIWDGAKWKPYKDPLPEGIPLVQGPTKNPKAAGAPASTPAVKPASSPVAGEPKVTHGGQASAKVGPFNVGDVHVNDYDNVFVWDGSMWINSAADAGYYNTATAPFKPKIADLWEAPGQPEKVWNGKAWVVHSPQKAPTPVATPAVITPKPTPPPAVGAPSKFTGSVVPPTAKAGDLWEKPNGVVVRYDGTKWDVPVPSKLEGLPKVVSVTYGHMAPTQPLKGHVHVFESGEKHIFSGGFWKPYNAPVPKTAKLYDKVAGGKSFALPIKQGVPKGSMEHPASQSIGLGTQKPASPPLGHIHTYPADPTKGKMQPSHYQWNGSSWNKYEGKVPAGLKDLTLPAGVNAPKPVPTPAWATTSTPAHKPVVQGEFETLNEGHSWGLEQAKSWKYTDDERQSLRRYTGSGYTEINGHLRGKLHDPDAAKHAAKIKAALNKTVIHKDAVVSRTVPRAPDAWKNLQVGDVFRDKAFLSTSVKPNWEWSSGSEAIKLKIKLKAGQKGIGGYVQPISLHSSEYEFLVNADMPLKVLEVHRTPGQPVTYVVEVDK